MQGNVRWIDINMLSLAQGRETDQVILAIDTHGADINALTTDRRPRTVLMIAIENNDKILFDALLARNPDLSVKDWLGYTALEHAARKGKYEFVVALLTHGAPASDDALRGAAVGLHTETVRELLYFGADPNIRASVSPYCNRKQSNQTLIDMIRSEGRGESTPERAKREGIVYMLENPPPLSYVLK